MEKENQISTANSVSVTIIITVWKRNYLEEQIESLLNQTVLPEQIWIIHYEDHIDIRPLIKRYLPVFPSIFIIEADLNLKFFGRYSMAGYVNTEYVWVLDDDVIPGRKWLERSCEKCSELNAVITCTGRIIPKDDFIPEKCSSGEIEKYFIGDSNDADAMHYCPVDTIVDYPCNSYFIKSSWVSDFWAIWPSTFLSGDDIHLSAALKIKRNVPTVVLAQSCGETTGNLRKEYGLDEHKSWLKPGWFETRESILRNLIQVQGWKPILWS